MAPARPELANVAALFTWVVFFSLQNDLEAWKSHIFTLLAWSQSQRERSLLIQADEIQLLALASHCPA